MMASVRMLAETVDIIVTAPYVVDIAALHVVVRSVGDDVIRQWCIGKTCQISKLASYLLKSLFEERRKEILERFCRAADFSKVVADSRPDILSQLLSRALDEGERSTTNLLCCRLLGAQPLQTSGFPADLPRYLEKLMRAIHQFPTTELLHAMRQIIAIQSARILELVSEDVLIDFISTCKLLTKDNTSNWHEAAIVSINIGSAVCEEVFLRVPGYLQDMGLPKDSDVFCDWAAKMLGYFDGLKAPRFLHSIVARVVFFTSRNQNIPMSIRMKNLDIVSEILQRFRYGIEEFSSENPDAVEKVWRNAAGGNLDFDARLSAFTVAHKITTAGTYSNYIEAVLSQLNGVLVSEDEPCKIYLHENAMSKVQGLTDALCSLLQTDSKTCVEMLHSMLDFIAAQCRQCQHPDVNTYTMSYTALVLLQALFESMKKHQHVFSILLSLLGKAESTKLTPWLQDLAGSDEPILQTNCRGSLACIRNLSRLRVQLCQTFSIVLLYGACTTPSTLSTKEFAFLQDRSFPSESRFDAQICQYSTEVDNHAFTARSLQYAREEGDWRQQIVSVMSDYQKQSAEAILDQVNTVCHEFEERCKNIEIPLVQAKSHAAELQEELDRTRTILDQQDVSNSALILGKDKADNLLKEKDNEISALVQEVTRLQESAEKQNDNIAQLTAGIASLKLEHACKITDLCVEAASTKQDLETLNKAERFSWEEQLEAERQDAERLRAAIAWLESEKHRSLEEQLIGHRTHEEELQRMKLEHEEAYRNVVEKTVQLETVLDHGSKEITELTQTVQEREGELRAVTERLHAFEISEQQWLHKNNELEERLQLAETKAQKVLAALQGK